MFIQIAKISYIITIGTELRTLPSFIPNIAEIVILKNIYEKLLKSLMMDNFVWFTSIFKLQSRMIQYTEQLNTVARQEHTIKWSHGHLNVWSMVGQWDNMM